MTYTNSDSTTSSTTADLAMHQLQIVVRWGQSILALRHVDPARPFVLGSDPEKCDYVVPGVPSDAPHALTAIEDGRVMVVVPSGARADLTLASGEPRPLCPVTAASKRFELCPGQEITVHLGELCVDVRGVDKAEALARRPRPEKRGVAATALSACLHLGILAATAAFVPPFAGDADAEITEQQRYTIQHYLDSAAERERDAASRPIDGSDGALSARAGSEPGHQDEVATAAPKHTQPGPNVPAIYGGRSGQGRGGPTTAAEALDEAQNGGMIALLTNHSTGTLSSWPSDGGALDGPGDGGMWHGDLPGPGDLLSDPMGPPGPGGYYTMPRFVTTPFPELGPYRPKHTSRTRKPSGPNVRWTDPVDSSKGIPAAVIQRIVRANFGRFRGCYEAGLRTNPSLAGRVSVRFMINRHGAVQAAGSAGSSLPDSAVVSCVVGAFRGLTFPAPESGVVTVTYPILFMPPATS